MCGVRGNLDLLELYWKVHLITSSILQETARSIENLNPSRIPQGTKKPSEGSRALLPPD
jgi:hypothetical protein